MYMHSSQALFAGKQAVVLWQLLLKTSLCTLFTFVCKGVAQLCICSKLH